MNNLHTERAAELAERLWAFTLSQSINELISVEALVRLIEMSISEAYFKEELNTFLEQVHCAFINETDIQESRLVDLISAESQLLLRQVAQADREVDTELLEEIMKVDLVSIVLKKLVERVLETFIEGVLNRDTKPLGQLGKSAFGLAARASKGIFEKVSSQIEGPLRQTMQAFLQGSMDKLKLELREILKSDELKPKLTEANISLLDFLFSQPVSRLYEIGLTKEEVSRLLREGTTVIEYALRETPFKAFFEQEIRRVFNSTQHLRLDELLSPELRALLDETIGQQTRQAWTRFFMSDAFSNEATQS